MAKHKGTGRFVVEHTMVDAFPKGTILHAHDGRDFGKVRARNLAGEHQELPHNWHTGAPKFIDAAQQERLLRLGAVRELTADEAELVGDDGERLPGQTPPAAGSSPPFTDAEKDAKIQLLERTVGELKDKVGFYDSQVVSGKLAAPKGFKAAGAAGITEASAGADVARLEGEVATKDAEIERLRVALNEAQTRAATLQGQAGPDDEGKTGHKRK